MIRRSGKKPGDNSVLGSIAIYTGAVTALTAIAIDKPERGKLAKIGLGEIAFGLVALVTPRRKRITLFDKYSTSSDQGVLVDGGRVGRTRWRVL